MSTLIRGVIEPRWDCCRIQGHSQKFLNWSHYAGYDAPSRLCTQHPEWQFRVAFLSNCRVEWTLQREKCFLSGTRYDVNVHVGHYRTVAVTREVIKQYDGRADRNIRLSQGCWPSGRIFSMCISLWEFTAGIKMNQMGVVRRTQGDKYFPQNVGWNSWSEDAACRDTHLWRNNIEVHLKLKIVVMCAGFK